MSVALIDPALPALPAIFDPVGLSALFSRPVHADRLRHKQGVSAVARLRTRHPGQAPPADARRAPDADPAPRWVATYAPHHAAKLDKTLARAANHGYDIDVIGLPGRHTLVAGPIGLDMKLHDTLRAFEGHHRLSLGPGRVLNYNPHRRVVFRMETAAGATVCKAGRADPAETAFLADLARRGVPVLQRIIPLDAPQAGTLRYYPWFGQGDLQQVAGEDGHDAARSAGAALALLHAQPTDLAPRPARDLLHKLRTLNERDLHLTPGSQARLSRIHAALVRRLGDDDRTALVHGDFSADQVLVDASHVVLADFDRSTTAPPGTDIGSFVAVDLLQERASGRTLRGHFLDGYEDAGGRIDQDTVLAWTAAHLLDRLDEPFRSCSPSWRDDTEERLEMLAALVA
ncbi:phosphotransferase family protein [Arthrobacter sp. SX1312]|uniref:phosphotransferase family protein n=1 Tax=Arthrobacter sp. SX1312 TaxID=2058896 RepID=UPI000CE4999C|nr:phosphotransferase [Arthrobacter sp. SX1312]